MYLAFSEYQKTVQMVSAALQTTLDLQDVKWRFVQLCAFKAGSRHFMCRGHPPTSAKCTSVPREEAV